MTVLHQNKPILVTGGTGYLASWIIHHLLSQGIIVHTTVRNPDDHQKTAHLMASEAEHSGTLRIFKADLLQPGSFSEAMHGCQTVIHTASPFFLDDKTDPQHNLLAPAVNGTENVLSSVNNTETVKRVVLTSSVVAIYGDNEEIKKAPGKIFTEQMWNTTSNLKHQPYSFSKTQAEIKAWEIARNQNRWDLITINPGFVLGPSRTLRTDSTSIRTMINMGDGTYRTGVPELWTGVVDVRDAAALHIRAAQTSTANGRYIAVARSIRFLDIAQFLLDNFGDSYPFPKMQVPKSLAWAMAPAVGLTRKFVTKNVGYRIAFDNSRSREELSFCYRPIRETVVEHFHQLLSNSLI